MKLQLELADAKKASDAQDAAKEELLKACNAWEDEKQAGEDELDNLKADVVGVRPLKAGMQGY